MTGRLTFQQLADANATRVVRWHPPTARPWSLADWSNAMNGEAGEAANLVKKLRRIETGISQDPNGTERAGLVEAIGFEIADTVIYADILAQELVGYGGLPLDELVAVKFNAVSRREGFPERLPVPARAVVDP